MKCPKCKSYIGFKKISTVYGYDKLEIIYKCKKCKFTDKQKYTDKYKK